MLTSRWFHALGFVALFAVTLPACGGYYGPVAPVAECEYNHTGNLVLVNLSDAGTPRDAYVNGQIVTTLPYGGQIVVSTAAGVVHTVEWVSAITGATVDVTRVLVDQCTTTTLTNHF